MNNIVLSIIIPVYNAESELRKCLDSVINQELKNYEVILVDDGSTDSSLLICKEYERRYDYVTVYSNTNHGPSFARNFGIGKARGKYIGFVDADDTIHSDMYYKLLGKAKQNDADIVVCNYYEWREKKSTLFAHICGEKTIVGKEIREIILRQFYGGNLIGLVQLWNKIYKTDFLVNTGILLDETIYRGEDFWFNLKLYEIVNRISFIDEGLYNYVADTSNSIMKRLDRNYYDEWKEMILYLNKCNEEYCFLFDKNSFYREILFNIHALLLKLISNNEDVDYILKDSFYDKIIVYNRNTSVMVKFCHFVHKHSIKLEKEVYKWLAVVYKRIRK